MNQKNTFDIPLSVRMSLAQSGETCEFPDGRVTVTMDDEDACSYTVGSAKRVFRQAVRKSKGLLKDHYSEIVNDNPSIFNIDPS